VAQDGDGQIIACGTYVALPVATRAYVAKFDASLGAPLVTTFAFGEAATVGGCALTGTGELVMSGSYSGSYGRRVAQGRDLFVASMNINDPGAAVTLSRFSSYGTPEDESGISPPLVEGGNAFVAGVTAGEWGEATGASSAKVFVAKVDTATLALL
jgi:hypothetical protein